MAVTLTREQRDAVLAHLAAGLSLTFLQGLVPTRRGEDHRQALDAYRGIIDEALAELHETKLAAFWVDALTLYDDLREDDYESYPLSLPPESLERVIRWVIQITETLFSLLGQKDMDRETTTDLADDVLDAHKACLGVLEAVSAEEGGRLMAAGAPFDFTCDRCGTKPPPSVKGPGDAIAQGWSRFELLREDGDTLDLVTVCPGCLTEVEEAGVWPSSTQGGPD
jgi:hypothetical protein